MNPGSTIETVYILDDYLGMTDAIIRVGGDAFLIESVDWDPVTTHPRVFRTGHLADDIVDDFMADVRRDYCDLTRKATQVASLGEQADWAEALVVIDVRTAEVLAQHVPGEPVRHRARDAFDGALLTVARTNGC